MSFEKRIREVKHAHRRSLGAFGILKLSHVGNAASTVLSTVEGTLSDIMKEPLLDEYQNSLCRERERETTTQRARPGGALKRLLLTVSNP